MANSLEKQKDKMLSQKGIEPSHTEWAAQIVFAPKKEWIVTI